MQKMILVITTFLLITAANISAYAQTPEKKEPEKKEATTADAWRQALPTNEQTYDSPAPVVMEESTDNVEVRETAAQIETRILDLERRLMEAFKKRDSATLKQLLADDFVPAGANITESQSDKTRFIEWALKNSELKSYAAEKTKVRVYPSSLAIVTTYYKQQTVIGGVPTEVDFTATDVWVKRKKQWQAVSHHVSQLPKTVTTVSRPAEAKKTP
jgi:ketosteroid isomerase-like protein